MALSLAEKAQRDIERLRATVDKLGPRHERATAAIEKKRAAFNKRKEALDAAEAKYSVLDEKKQQAERLIAALEAAIGTGSEVADVEDTIAALEAEDVSEGSEDGEFAVL